MPQQLSKLEIDLEPLQLVGRESQHYLALESLREVFLGRSTDLSGAVRGIRDAVKDWDRMLGGRSVLTGVCEGLIAKIEVGDKIACRNLYLLASPLIFYIHALYQITRKGWRNAVIASGIYCERIVRNLALTLRMRVPTTSLPVSEPKSFADKNGKVKHDLESLGFASSEDLYHLLKRLYAARSSMGPHDVPPPEPLEAKINVSLCLPVYLDYLHALTCLGGPSSAENKEFISFMDQAARVHVQLAFGAEIDQKPAGLVVKDRLYRVGFFFKDRSLRGIASQLRDEGYSFSDSVLANALRKLATGKNAVLTRKEIEGRYFYCERLPPSEHFRSVV
jgi:hypothetical protein